MNKPTPRNQPSRPREQFIIRIAAIGLVTLSIPVLGFGLLYLAGMYMDHLYPMTVDSTYANRDEAEADNLFGRGWMPRDMPATMNGIRIRTDVDLNIAWAEFTTDETGVEAIRTRYKNVESTAIPVPGRSGVSWWPKSLTSESQMENADFEYYVCKSRNGFDGPAYLALDPKTHRVYYWLR